MTANRVSLLFLPLLQLNQRFVKTTQEYTAIFGMGDIILKDSKDAIQEFVAWFFVQFSAALNGRPNGKVSRSAVIRIHSDMVALKKDLEVVDRTTRTALEALSMPLSPDEREGVALYSQYVKNLFEATSTLEPLMTGMEHNELWLSDEPDPKEIMDRKYMETAALSSKLVVDLSHIVNLLGNSVHIPEFDLSSLGGGNSLKRAAFLKDRVKDFQQLTGMWADSIEHLRDFSALSKIIPLIMGFSESCRSAEKILNKLPVDLPPEDRNLMEMASDLLKFYPGMGKGVFEKTRLFCHLHGVRF